MSFDYFCVTVPALLHLYLIQFSLPISAFCVHVCVLPVARGLGALPDYSTREPHPHEHLNSSITPDFHQFIVPTIMVARVLSLSFTRYFCLLLYLIPVALYLRNCHYHIIQLSTCLLLTSPHTLHARLASPLQPAFQFVSPLAQWINMVLLLLLQPSCHAFVFDRSKQPDRTVRQKDLQVLHRYSNPGTLEYQNWVPTLESWKGPVLPSSVLPNL